MTLADKLQARIAETVQRFGYASVMRAEFDKMGVTRSADQDDKARELAKDLNLHAVPGVMCITFYPSLADWNKRGGSRR